MKPDDFHLDPTWKDLSKQVERAQARFDAYKAAGMSMTQVQRDLQAAKQALNDREATIGLDGFGSWA